MSSSLTRLSLVRELIQINDYFNFWRYNIKIENTIEPLVSTEITYVQPDNIDENDSRAESENSKSPTRSRILDITTKFSNFSKTFSRIKSIRNGNNLKNIFDRKNRLNSESEKEREIERLNISGSGSGDEGENKNRVSNSINKEMADNKIEIETELQRKQKIIDEKKIVENEKEKQKQKQKQIIIDIDKQIMLIHKNEIEENRKEEEAKNMKRRKRISRALFFQKNEQ